MGASDICTAPPPSAAPLAATAASFANAIRTDMIAAFTLSLAPNPKSNRVFALTGSISHGKETQITPCGAMELTTFCQPKPGHIGNDCPIG